MQAEVSRRSASEGAARLAIVQSVATILWRSILVVALTELSVMLLLEVSGEPITIWLAFLDTVVLAAIALPALYAVILRPVTRLAAAHAAAAAESRFQTIAQVAQDGIVIFGSDRKIRFANTAFERMHGFDPGGLQGLQMESLLPLDLRKEFREGVTAHLQGRKGSVIGQGVKEFAGLRSDGERFPIEISVSELAGNGEVQFVIVARDITERKQAEEAIRTSEKRLHDLLEDLPVAVRVIHEGRLVFVNPADAHLHGFEHVQDELAFGDVLAQITPDDRERVREYYRRRAAGEMVPAEYEVHRLRRDGTSFPALVHATRIVYEGKPASLAVIQDITDRHRLKMYELILPVCCVCGKIRNDEGVEHGHGDWERLDQFVAAHSDAQVSHTFCPECLVEYRRREGLS
ncbi:MAG: PAS domain S-box protein [Acidobacteria bacterium]|nr:PAS domain S-box protein [Acidobacteriota bacterium]MCL5286722.1 PAS domain S-box protein [Acidobacteriota bacterium]